MNSHDRKGFIEKLILVSVMIALIGGLVFIIMRYEEIISKIHNVVSIINPFIYGLCIAYILTPLVNKLIHRFEKSKYIKKKDFRSLNYRAIAIVEVLFITGVISFTVLIVYNLLNSGLNILNLLPKAFDNLLIMIDKQIGRHEQLKMITGDSAKEFVKMITDYMSSVLSDNIQTLIPSIALNIKDFARLIVDLLIGMIISVFALANRTQFKEQSIKILKAFCNDNVQRFILEEAREIDNKFSGFFIGKIIDSGIVGVISLVVMVVIGLPYAFLISFIIFITNIIPIVGPFLGAIPGALIILSESPTKVIHFIIFIIILQQIDGHIIGPKCIGNVTGLNTFWVLFALIVAGGLWGIVGMLIGVPLFAVIYDLIRRVVDMRIEKKEQMRILKRREKYKKRAEEE